VISRAANSLRTGLMRRPHSVTIMLPQGRSGRVAATGDEFAAQTAVN